ncbi:MAG TPA: DUF58 domain-containing protein [Bryobacteraceae bacterium]|nr:DUF58 domain-containing protein [Bryobacteraceae bacterium]
MKEGYTIVPSALLIWIVAGIGFPAAILAALFPGARIAAICVGSLIAMAAFIDAALRRRALAGIRVETPELVRLFKDREGEIQIKIHNANRNARRLRIGVAAPEGLETQDEDRVVQLPASAEAAAISWTFTGRRRGRYRFDSCFLEAPSLLGLFAVRRRDPLALEMRVYPNLRRKDDLKALRRGAEGVHSLRQIGRGREFEKLREYVAGDALDEIHWKAAARRGHPITKVFQVERTQEIYVIIDASRLSARPAGEETALERSIVAALLIGAAAERSGDRFGLAAFSTQVEAFARAANGKSHYAACRDAIYQLQPRLLPPDFEEIATFLRLRLRRRALLFFLTSLDDPVLAENFARAMQLLARRHLVVAAMPKPDWARPLFEESSVESPRDIYRALAGHLGWKKLRETESALGRLGIRLALIQPEHFGGELIGLYDEIKQRQLL